MTVDGFGEEGFGEGSFGDPVLATFQPYSTVTDVKNVLGGDAASGTAATLSNTVLLDAIYQADSMIRSYIGYRYQIPFEHIDQDDNPLTTVAAEPVRWWSRDIAAFLATLTYKRNQDVTPDDPVRLRLNMALQQMVAVRDSKTHLAFPPAQVQSADPAVTVINLYVGSLFGPSDFDLQQVPAARTWGSWPGGPV